MTELTNAATIGLSIQPQVLAASNQGASVDMFNGDISTLGLLAFSAATQAMTGVTFQVEEWNGTTAAASTWTAIPNMVSSAVTAVAGTMVTMIGLRTQRYARWNVITFSSGNVGVAAVIMGMPKSSAGSTATGYSRSPSV